MLLILRFPIISKLNEPFGLLFFIFKAVLAGFKHVLQNECRQN